ncbi:Mitochondrial substrate/solute carrier [Trypanosoma melophagium]|uniref:Mitochondrial substrate/solute carrier n=1 Tax=Trypanosoma melophagium TaxID=715481 RepID=UPI00351A3700|nr:Mitochondrial substrate/solute carrier [Trypanosoma melophagium]
MFGSTLVTEESLALDTYTTRPTGSSAIAVSDAIPSLCDVLAHNPEVGPHEHTNSVNRSYSDLDSKRFLLYAAALCWARTALQQPFNLALARQQTCSAASSMSALQIVRHVYRSEGRLRGLTQGMTALTLGCAISEAIYLWLFEYSRERLPLESDASRDAVSGYISDAACRLVHLPLSIVALRQMTANKVRGNVKQQRSGMFRTLSSMYREGGMRTVFAGYSTTLLVGCQWTAVWWSMYGYTKSRFYQLADRFLEDEAEQKKQRDLKLKEKDTFSSASFLTSWKQWLWAKDDNVVLNSTASVLTSASTAVLFNPYLVLRANLQVTPNARMWRVARDLYRARGVRGFYGGLALNVGTCLIDGVLASTSYEYAKLWSDKTHLKKSV